MVLMTLIGAIGFGGWTVLNEIQRVQMAPIENAPSVMSDLDPLRPSGLPVPEAGYEVSGVFAPPSDALDRLYRPQALDVPVLVARDAPISTLDPSQVGNFASPELAALASVGRQNEAPVTPRVVGADAPDLALVAARPSWSPVRPWWWRADRQASRPPCR